MGNHIHNVENRDIVDNTEHIDTATGTANDNRDGTRRARRLRRRHKRQQKKQRKKKMKRIKEKIRTYEKLEFYDWILNFYSKCTSVPRVRKLVNGRFGKDIGNVILEFLPSIM